MRTVQVVDNGNGQMIALVDPLETLARYNAERSRGIVHTPEWCEAMASLQAEFTEETP